MMRSLYSGVSGLKSHQTRMDVIGNNIANVNTTSYKTMSINFSDLMYQTTQAATGPNSTTGTAGTNAKQIGLGVQTAAISTNMEEGATQSTGGAFDMKISGEEFFIVSDGTNTYFTRDGSFYVDAAGNLAMSSTGYNVMGWTDIDENGNVVSGQVQAIKVLGADNETYEAAATTDVYASGILDKEDTNLDSSSGKAMSFQVYDARGYMYTVQYAITPVTGTQSSNKEVSNKEELYDLSNTSLYLIDNSTYTITYTDAENKTATLSGTSLPSDLLNAIKSEAQATTTPDGTEHDVTVTIDQTFLDKYEIDDLGDYAYLLDKQVNVNYSGGTAYSVDGTSDGVVNITSDALTALGITAPTTVGEDGKVTLPKILLTTKTYSDGSDNQYIVKNIDADTTSTDSTVYSGIKSLLKTVTSEIQAQYTTTEETTTNEEIEGQYTLTLESVLDSENNAMDITNLTDTTHTLVYSDGDGKFAYIDSDGTDTFTLNLSLLGDNFSDVTVDMSASTNVNNNGTSTLAISRGTVDDTSSGTGRKVGELTGVSVDTSGKIYASYSNGQQKLLGQIAVTSFANASGLQKEGDNLYSTTNNSGDFDGVGQDISANGDSIETGVLEMSNVDLSTEFTNMITTQRGFQANSRTITVSDTLLEELINLKR